MELRRRTAPLARRINDDHRLVYRPEGDEIEVTQLVRHARRSKIMAALHPCAIVPGYLGSVDLLGVPRQSQVERCFW